MSVVYKPSNGFSLLTVTCQIFVPIGFMVTGLNLNYQPSLLEGVKLFKQPIWDIRSHPLLLMREARKVFDANYDWTWITSFKRRIRFHTPWDWQCSYVIGKYSWLSSLFTCKLMIWLTDLIRKCQSLWKWKWRLNWGHSPPVCQAAQHAAEQRQDWQLFVKLKRQEHLFCI